MANGPTAWGRAKGRGRVRQLESASTLCAIGRGQGLPYHTGSILEAGYSANAIRNGTFRIAVRTDLSKDTLLGTWHTPC